MSNVAGAGRVAPGRGPPGVESRHAPGALVVIAAWVVAPMLHIGPVEATA